MDIKNSIILTCICVTSTCLSSTAHAKMLPNDDVRSVFQRESEALDPLGIPVRSFKFHPGMDVALHYDDNIYRDASSKQDDWITTINPSAELVSDWSLHELRLYADAWLTRYGENESENVNDIRIGASGRYDVTYGTYFHGGFQFDETHEERSSPDDVQGDAPTELDIWSANIGFTRDLARLKLFAEGRIKDIEYDNASRGTTTIDNSARNRTQYEGDLKLAYELSPNYELFIRSIYDEREYDHTTAMLDRGSSGWRLSFGGDLNISGKVKATIHGGHIRRDYETIFSDVSTLDYGASLIWNLSGLTSVLGDLDRNVIETTQSNTSSYIRTRASLGFEHALRDNLLGEAKLTFTNDEFVGSPREDDSWGGTIGLTYKPFRGARLGLMYDYTGRDSNQSLNDYKSHRLLLRVGYTF